MKKILSIVLLAIFISCGKDGSMGPQGEQGIQGIRGEKGEDGSTIYSGAVIPPADLGNMGDFYFRTGTSDFYGPKTSSGWGAPTNLKGATGATGSAGTAGSKILSGTTVPAAGIGVNGDFYFRTTTADFYGPKVSSGWGTPINLRGPQGPTGPAGNANVKLFTFAGFYGPYPGNYVTKTFPLNGADFDQSILYAYVGMSPALYPLPGSVGLGHSYRIVYQRAATNTSIRIIKEDGAGRQFFEVLRIYVVRANSTIHLSSTSRGITAPDGKIYVDETLRSMSERDFRSALGITGNWIERSAQGR
ncbi:hypothetical protein FXV77_14315 [Sphingobacterium phlebotomi]|uniref:Collagen-like protein n=1 Tax=Sphingobacterium phlebotomi TaxID=2605433 RepID=A0A5D4H2S2_9SPHI|nr:hypothetical protein [Sphingobacterium phlebotomi]TYR35116.1 hypothetical protein FXV77_14315 [Sphingobacterium phlebotomi]